jgi:pimeloyl-ACP methyl ester carboxylesterase
MLQVLKDWARLPAPAPNLINTWGVPKTFDYQGLGINYYEAGDGPPVILLHGYGGCSYTWRFLAPALVAAPHRVFSLDLKGYGLSAKPANGGYAVHHQAHMVAAFIRAHHLRDLVIIGHSMGGGVALMTYLLVRPDAPDRIKKLVLIDSAGYPQKMPWFIGVSQIPGLADLTGGLIPPRLATCLVLSTCYYHPERITAEQIDTYAYYGSLPGARQALIKTARQIVPADFDALTMQYRTISVPVLIVWGAEDVVVPLSVGHQFHRDIPDSRLEIIPQCGHMPPEEEPFETNRLITSFL